MAELTCKDLEAALKRSGSVSVKKLARCIADCLAFLVKKGVRTPSLFEHVAPNKVLLARRIAEKGELLKVSFQPVEPQVVASLLKTVLNELVVVPESSHSLVQYVYDINNNKERMQSIRCLLACHLPSWSKSVVLCLLELWTRMLENSSLNGTTDQLLAQEFGPLLLGKGRHPWLRTPSKTSARVNNTPAISSSLIEAFQSLLIDMIHNMEAVTQPWGTNDKDVLRSIVTSAKHLVPTATAPSSRTPSPSPSQPSSRDNNPLLLDGPSPDSLPSPLPAAPASDAYWLSLDDRPRLPSPPPESWLLPTASSFTKDLSLSLGEALEREFHLGAHAPHPAIVCSKPIQVQGPPASTQEFGCSEDDGNESNRSGAGDTVNGSLSEANILRIEEDLPTRSGTVSPALTTRSTSPADLNSTSRDRDMGMDRDEKLEGQDTTRLEGTRRRASAGDSPLSSGGSSFMKPPRSRPPSPRRHSSADVGNSSNNNTNSNSNVQLDVSHVQSIVDSLRNACVERDKWRAECFALEEQGEGELIKKFRCEVERLTAECDKLASELVKITAERDSHLARWVNMATQVEAISSGLETFKREHATMDSERQHYKVLVEKLQADMSRKTAANKEQVETLRGDIQRLQGKLKSSEGELEGMRRELSASALQSKHMAEERDEARTECAALKERLQAAQAGWEKSRRDFSGMQERLVGEYSRLQQDLSAARATGNSQTQALVTTRDTCTQTEGHYVDRTTMTSRERTERLKKDQEDEIQHMEKMVQELVGLLEQSQSEAMDLRRRLKKGCSTKSPFSRPRSDSAPCLVPFSPNLTNTNLKTNTNSRPPSPTITATFARSSSAPLIDFKHPNASLFSAAPRSSSAPPRRPPPFSLPGPVSLLSSSSSSSSSPSLPPRPGSAPPEWHASTTHAPFPSFPLPTPLRSPSSPPPPLPFGSTPSVSHRTPPSMSDVPFQGADDSKLSTLSPLRPSGSRPSPSIMDASSFLHDDKPLPTPSSSSSSSSSLRRSSSAPPISDPRPSSHPPSNAPASRPPPVPAYHSSPPPTPMHIRSHSLPIAMSPAAAGDDICSMMERSRKDAVEARERARQAELEYGHQKIEMHSLQSRVSALQEEKAHWEAECRYFQALGTPLGPRRTSNVVPVEVLDELKAHMKAIIDDRNCLGEALQSLNRQKHSQQTHRLLPGSRKDGLRSNSTQIQHDPAHVFVSLTSIKRDHPSPGRAGPLYSKTKSASVPSPLHRTTSAPHRASPKCRPSPARAGPLLYRAKSLVHNRPTSAPSQPGTHVSSHRLCEKSKSSSAVLLESSVQSRTLATSA